MEKVSADIQAAKGMTLLSQREIDAITQADAQLMHLFRRCALAVLNTGNEDDDQMALMNRFKDFTVEIVPQSRGIALRLSNAPASAFVAGKIVEKKLSVRQAENFVLLFKNKKHRSKNTKDTNIIALELSISNKIGLNVDIQNNKRNKGKISFEYKDLDQLNKIIDIIKSNY